jgi:hypothetical protein
LAMEGCSCDELCFLCAAATMIGRLPKKHQMDALFWSTRAGLPMGQIHLAVSEAIRVDPKIPQEAWDAVKAKHEVLGGASTADEFIEALESIRRGRR